MSERTRDDFVVCEAPGVSVIPLASNNLLFDKALATSQADTV